MSSVPCGSKGETTNISNSDFDRWTNNLRNVLDSPRARKKFGEFLNTRNFKDAQVTLGFWEMCDKFLAEAKTNHRALTEAPNKHNSEVQKKFKQNAASIVEMAEDKINFNFQELRCMFQAIESGNAQQIIKIISEAQSKSARLLNDRFHLFRNVLLKDRGLI